MTESSMALGGFLRKINADLDGDFLREGVRLLAHLIMVFALTEATARF